MRQPWLTKQLQSRPRSKPGTNNGPWSKLGASGGNSPRCPVPRENRPCKRRLLLPHPPPCCNPPQLHGLDEMCARQLQGPSSPPPLQSSSAVPIVHECPSHTNIVVAVECRCAWTNSPTYWRSQFPRILEGGGSALFAIETSIRDPSNIID